MSPERLVCLLFAVGYLLVAIIYDSGNAIVSANLFVAATLILKWLERHHRGTPGA